jgi:hypothetical protein
MSKGLTETRLSEFLLEVLTNQMNALMETVFNPVTASEDLVKYQQYGAAVLAMRDIIQDIEELPRKEPKELREVLEHYGVELKSQDTKTEENI